jgi:hypothetical protein
VADRRRVKSRSECEGVRVDLDEKIELLGEILGSRPEDTTDPRVLLRAVGRAYERLAARGGDPWDERWLMDRDLFRHAAKPLIAEAWGEASGDGSAAMPRDDGRLVRAWLEWGCRPAGCLPAWFGIVSPH